MLVIYELDNNVKPIIDIVIIGNGNRLETKGLLDTGADKAIWFGSERELYGVGAKYISSDGHYEGATGDICNGCKIFSIDINFRSDINNKGIFLRNVEVMLPSKRVQRDKYLLLLPYGLFRNFSIRIAPAKWWEKNQNVSENQFKFGSLEIDTLSARINYEVKKSANAVPIEIAEIEEVVSESSVEDSNSESDRVQDTINNLNSLTKNLFDELLE